MNRKQRRALKKQNSKAVRNQTAEVEQSISRMPQQCDECATAFDKTNHEQITKWRIAVYDDGRIHLVCPACVPNDLEEK